MERGIHGFDRRKKCCFELPSSWECSGPVEPDRVCRGRLWNHEEIPVQLKHEWIGKMKRFFEHCFDIYDLSRCVDGSTRNAPFFLPKGIIFQKNEIMVSCGNGTRVGIKPVSWHGKCFKRPMAGDCTSR